MLTGDPKAPILILGVGNVLQQDDGVGVHVVQALMTRTWPEEVELIDGGTAGLDLLPSIEGRKRVIVIDAVDGAHPPGTLFRFTPDDINRMPVEYNSLHQLGLIETLQMARLLGTEPDEAVIYGVQPGEVEWGETLSEPVSLVVPRILELVTEEVEHAMSALRAVGGDLA